MTVFMAVDGAGVRHGERGYAMVTLLVAIALMSIFMSAALPAWRHAAQREKEAELLWRGRQYDRALQLYRRQYATPGPPSLDILIEEKFLRKKYKDPITGGDFELKSVSPMGNVEIEPGQEGRTQSGRRRAQRESARQEEQQQRGRPARGQLIGGVRSRSKARSIMVLNGRQHYNEWDFTYVPYGSRQTQPVEQTSPSRPGIQPRGRGARPGQSPGSSRSRPPAQGQPGGNR